MSKPKASKSDERYFPVDYWLWRKSDKTVWKVVVHVKDTHGDYMKVDIKDLLIPEEELLHKLQNFAATTEAKPYVVLVEISGLPAKTFAFDEDQPQQALQNPALQAFNHVRTIYREKINTNEWTTDDPNRSSDVIVIDEGDDSEAPAKRGRPTKATGKEASKKKSPRTASPEKGKGKRKAVSKPAKEAPKRSKRSVAKASESEEESDSADAADQDPIFPTYNHEGIVVINSVTNKRFLFLKTLGQEGVYICLNTWTALIDQSYLHIDDGTLLKVAIVDEANVLQICEAASPSKIAILKPTNELTALIS